LIQAEGQRNPNEQQHRHRERGGFRFGAHRGEPVFVHHVPEHQQSKAAHRQSGPTHEHDIKSLHRAHGIAVPWPGTGRASFV
jgi:hypothetical protein